jgi:hypothetical protein
MDGNCYYYFLLSNGEVYYYNLFDIDSNKLVANKIQGLSLVKRLIVPYSYYSGNVPPSYKLIAITNKNEYVTIKEV